MEDIKCFLITMGVGFALGAMAASTNKKVSDVAKKAQNVAMEKIDMAKESFVNLKENIQEKIQENQDQKEQKGEVNLNKNEKQSKRA